MATTDVQISAFISAATKDLLEKHARATGLKKGHVVEMALLHHLQALQEIPADVIIPPRLVVSAKRLTSPGAGGTLARCQARRNTQRQEPT